MQRLHVLVMQTSFCVTVRVVWLPDSDLVFSGDDLPVPGITLSGFQAKTFIASVISCLPRLYPHVLLPVFRESLFLLHTNSIYSNMCYCRKLRACMVSANFLFLSLIP